MYKFLFLFDRKELKCKKYGKILKDLKVVIKLAIYGNIKSLKRIVKTGRNGHRVIQESIIKPRIDKRGYKIVSLRIYPQKYFLSLHRLVAETFIPNPNDYPVINHIDGNPSNNNVKNLEWCTQSYNVKCAFKCGKAKPFINTYETRNGKLPCTPIKVLQYSLNNEFIKEYSSIKEASVITKTSSKGISLCCRNLQKTANNFHWRYADK